MSPRPVPAMHIYKLFTVDAQIFFCDKHLPSFKRFSGTIVSLAGNGELTKAAAKEVKSIIDKVKGASE